MCSSLKQKNSINISKLYYLKRKGWIPMLKTDQVQSLMNEYEKDKARCSVSWLTNYKIKHVSRRTIKNVSCQTAPEVDAGIGSKFLETPTRSRCNLCSLWNQIIIGNRSLGSRKRADSLVCDDYDVHVVIYFKPELSRDVCVCVCVVRCSFIFGAPFTAF